MERENMSELEQIRDELKFMRSCFQVSLYVYADYFVPINQIWNKESNTGFGLLFQNKQYYVTA